jgi:group I intron endonuclease
VNCGVYIIVNLINNKFYIGCAIDFEDRWRLHKLELNRDKHHNYHLQQAWNLHGEANFKFIVLEFVTDKIILLEREQYWIDRLNATDRNIAYNICKTARNRTGVKASEETRKKLSESHKGHKQSEETKAKRALKMQGNKHSKGSKRSLEHINAMRKGRKYSPETRAKISLAQKGKIVSEVTRLKQSIAAKNRWNENKPLDYTCDMWV